MERKQIVIFGGCFNPPLNSHFSLAQQIINEYENIEKIVFVPVNSKYQKADLIDNEHRYKMLELVCKKNDKLDVSKTEIDSDRPLYTIETLRIFQAKYSEYEIAFIIGSDNLKELNTWQKADELTKDFKIYVLERDKDNIEEVFDKIINDFDFDICLFGHSHKYLYRKYKNKIFINPGSIGQSNDYSSYKYCIIEIIDEINVILKEFNVRESFDKLVNYYKKTKYYKDNYVWANLVLYTIRDGIAYCPLFLEEFNHRIEKLGELNEKEFNKIWDKTFKDLKKTYDIEEI